MKDAYQVIGKNIRVFRKKQRLTLVQLAERINKSKATLSKYERGEIAIDIMTLIKISEALSISFDQLCPTGNMEEVKTTNGSKNTPAFFANTDQFYAYVYDGRSNQLIRCVFDVLDSSQKQSNKVYMYMNFKKYLDYQDCENTYVGTIDHFDAMTNIRLRNVDSHMEQASIQILASFLDSATKWGLFCSLSSRPMMPIATKMLFSKTRLDENQALIDDLKISRQDIKQLKQYNMLSVT